MKLKATLLTALFLAVFQLNAFACKCRQQSIEENMAVADHVFLAKVIGIKKSKLNNESTVTIRVSRHFKGKTRAKTIKITTAMESASCGFSFEMDKNYVIYAYKTVTRNQLTTSSCTRTTASVKEETEGIMALNTKK